MSAAAAGRLNAAINQLDEFEDTAADEWPTLIREVLADLGVAHTELQPDTDHPDHADDVVGGLKGEIAAYVESEAPAGFAEIVAAVDAGKDAVEAALKELQWYETLRYHARGDEAGWYVQE
jgi:hypothetical protein